MKLWRRVRQVPESVLLCLAFVLIPFWPRSVIAALARGLGGLAFHVVPGLRRLALANLDVAFGTTLTSEEKERVVKESFRTFVLVALDLFWFAAFTRRRIRRYVAFDSSFGLYFNARPVVAVTGHFGNWEVLGQATALWGHPLMSVAAPLENPFVDRVLTRLRQKTGQGVVFKEGAIKVLLKTLRDGGRVGLLMDQNTLPDDGGEFVSFFGLPVPMSKAVAALVQRTGARVVFGYCIPDDRGHYTASVVAVDISERGATQAVATAIEAVIRTHPGRWLWMYKRWKYMPPGAPADRYPFYARKRPVE